MRLSIYGRKRFFLNFLFRLNKTLQKRRYHSPDFVIFCDILQSFARIIVICGVDDNDLDGESIVGAFSRRRQVNSGKFDFVFSSFFVIHYF